MPDFAAFWDVVLIFTGSLLHVERSIVERLGWPDTRGIAKLVSLEKLASLYYAGAANGSFRSVSREETRGV